MGRKLYCQKLLRTEDILNDYFVNRLDGAMCYRRILDRTRNLVYVLFVYIYRKIVRKTVHNLVGINVHSHRDRHAVVYSLGGITYG